MREEVRQVGADAVGELRRPLLQEAGHALSGVGAAAAVSVALSRQMMWRMLGADHPMVAHRADSRGILYRGRSADTREGVASFLEKRPPDFPDRVSADLPDLFPDWVDPDFA